MPQTMQEGESRPALSKEQFPVKLYTILELAGMRGCSGCSWLPHGRAFKIDDERVFMKVWVPKFFKQTKIRSFHRQLYLWGFKRLSTRSGAYAWYNEFFVRGYPEEMKNMVRIKNKSEARRVTMESELISAGSFASEGFQFKCGLTSSSEDHELPLLSSPAVTSGIPTTAQMQAVLALNQDMQNPVADVVWPSRNYYKAPLPRASSGIDEAKCSLTSQLEPLPFKEKTVLPTKIEAEREMKFTPNPLPIDNGSPLDEFSTYIDKMMRPVDDGIPPDEFSAYIDNMIQTL